MFQSGFGNMFGGGQQQQQQQQPQQQQSWNPFGGMFGGQPAAAPAPAAEAEARHGIVGGLEKDVIENPEELLL